MWAINVVRRGLLVSRMQFGDLIKALGLPGFALRDDLAAAAVSAAVTPVATGTRCTRVLRRCRLACVLLNCKLVG